MVELTEMLEKHEEQAGPGTFAAKRHAQRLKSFRLKSNAYVSLLTILARLELSAIIQNYE